MKLDIPQLNSLEEILDKSVEMEKVTRWGKYFERGGCRKENTLQHSYKTSLLATIILENEKKYQTDFDPYIVLKATVLHDLGEIEEGDTEYVFKTIQGDRREREFFGKLIKPLGQEIGEGLQKAYDIQTIGKKGFEEITGNMGEKYKKEALLFETIERYGYIIFAYRQYRRDGKEEILVQTLRNQHKKLKLLSERLPGFKEMFYTQRMHESIISFIKSYDGRYIEERTR